MEICLSLRCSLRLPMKDECTAPGGSLLPGKDHYYQRIVIYIINSHYLHRRDRTVSMRTSAHIRTGTVLVFKIGRGGFKHVRNRGSVEDRLHTCIWLPDGCLPLPPKERCSLGSSSYITNSPYLNSKDKQVVSDQCSVSFHFTSLVTGTSQIGS